MGRRIQNEIGRRINAWARRRRKERWATRKSKQITARSMTFSGDSRAYSCSRYGGKTWVVETWYLSHS